MKKVLLIVSIALFTSCQKELDVLKDGDIVQTCVSPTMLKDGRIVRACTNGLDNGGVWIVPLSGVPPFEYSKDGGVTYVSGGDSIYGWEWLKEGSYFLRLKDSKGCESEIVKVEVTRR